MSVITPGPSRGPAPRAENDVYTALMVIAFLFVLCATIYVSYKTYSIFGSLWPPHGS